RHSLSYQNNHRPDLGAYLVNALLPKNRDIEITEQHRDFLQRGIRLTFNVKSPVDRSTLPPWPLAFGLGFTVLVGFGVVSRTSVAPSADPVRIEVCFLAAYGHRDGDFVLVSVLTVAAVCDRRRSVSATASAVIDRRYSERFVVSSLGQMPAGRFQACRRSWSSRS